MKHVNQPLKRLSCFILALAMMLSMMPMTAFEADAADEKTLYLNPGPWNVDGARFAAYFFDNGNTWVDMTDADGDGIYEATAPSGYPKVIFCRMNGSTSTNDWSNKWNQSSDQTIPSDGKNLYTVTGWETSDGSWSTHDPLSTDCYLVGSFNEWNKTANEFRLESSGKTTGVVTMDLAANTTYEFKVVKSGSWYGNGGTITGDVTGWEFETGKDNTKITTAQAGEYVFSFEKGSNKLSVTYPVVEPEPISKTVYCINSLNWSEIYGHAWIDTNNTTVWPGIEMDKTGETVNGFDIYSLTVAVDYSQVIFNKGEGGEGNQTADLSFNEGQYYDLATGVWYATLADVPPVTTIIDYYLVGYINGADYGCNDDAANMGEYKFADGTLTATFASDSYVFLKTTNNADWFMCNGFAAASPATLYNTTDSGKFTEDVNKLFVPGNVEVTFTLVENGDGSLTLSYTTAGDGEDDEQEPVVPEGTYIVAGSSALLGSSWDPSDLRNKMELNSDGLYEKTFYDVYPGSYELKITDGSWNNSWGKDGGWDNYTFELTGDDIRNVTITFNAETKAISYDAVETGEKVDPLTNVTIYFRNTGMWDGDNVRYHAWVENGSNDIGLTGEWPGKKMDVATSETETVQNWYKATLTEEDFTQNAYTVGFVFSNNGADQTVDITINQDGVYYYDGGQLTAMPPAGSWPDGRVSTVKYEVTLHFADSMNWGGINLYTWTATGATPTGSWPGTAAGLGEDGFYSVTFTYEAPENQGLNFIFSGSGGQTVDLALSSSDFVNNKAEKWVALKNEKNDEGKYTAEIVSNKDAVAVSPVVNGNTVTFMYKDPDASSVCVAGSFNSWNGTANPMEKNQYGVWSITLENVAYGIHQYKFVVSHKDWENKGWMLDPLNSWVYTEENGNQNSAFLISDPSRDNNEVTIKVHYDAPSAQWNVCAWGATGLEPQYDFENDVATITLDGRANQYVAFKVRKSIDGNDWAEQSGEIRVDLANTVSGTIDVWVGSDFSVSQSLNDDVVYANKIKSVELDYDNNTIVIQTGKSVANADTAFTIYQNGAETGIIKSVTVSGSTYTLALTEELDLVNLYTYKIGFNEDIAEAQRSGIHVIGTNTVYASDKFADKFTYDGELGALWTEDSTTFRVWAPTAASVSVNLYSSGTDKTDDLTDTVTMTAGEDGTWTATVEGNQNGVYYTYSVTVDGETVESIDPYARTAGVNGQRGMVIDLDSTDPEGWENDRNPNPITKYSDAIIYELHVRDFSIDDSSGMTNKGKYLAFTEQNTTIPGTDISTGIDYLEDLGITHLHLLPVYDYGSVDESKLDEPQFNWGYDPVNYNVPEGSYSTDPYSGATRVKEFKEMVMSLHEADISVIMDVVYNHVYDAGKFSMNMIVPKYFSRVNADGSYSNGSGCGNDTASEREMVRKYIVESVLYWHQEYHIDGFRFDLVGLLDETTINEIVDTVHACCPDVIFYGEGWTLGTAVEPGNDMATQANSAGTPNFAYFSDTIRNLLAGSNGSSLGYVSGLPHQEEPIANNFMASPWWSNDPQQIVQYASCHDNYTLIDKLILSTGKSGIDADIIKMNNLAAAIYMTSQGIPFIHAGEEFLREKLEEDGGRCENSYNASDYVNHIEWSNLKNATYADNVDYYQGLIAFRNAHPALRMTSNAQIKENIKYTWVTNEVVMFTIDSSAVEGESADTIIVIFNATQKPAEVSLPAGQWNICINNTTAGTDSLGTAESTVSVAGISAMVLTQGDGPEASGTIEAVSATLLYEDMIQIRYRFKVEADNVAEYGMYIFSQKEDAENHDSTKAAQTQELVRYESEEGVCYFGCTDGIAAKEMGDSQFMVGYLKLSNGEYVYSDVLEYSPRIYAQRMVAKEDTSPATKLLCNALMQYGAAAQLNFKYKTEQLMNVGFDEVPYDERVMDGNVFSLESATRGFTTEAATLLFEGAITYRFRYSVSSDLEGKTLYLEYTVMGVTDSVELKKIDGFYCGYIDGIAAKDLDEAIVVKPYYLDDSGEKVYGPELIYNGYEYAWRTITNESSATEAKNLAEALTMYIYAANQAIKSN